MFRVPSICATIGVGGYGERELRGTHLRLERGHPGQVLPDQQALGAACEQRAVGEQEERLGSFHEKWEEAVWVSSKAVYLSCGHKAAL